MVVFPTFLLGVRVKFTLNHRTWKHRDTYTMLVNPSEKGPMFWTLPHSSLSRNTQNRKSVSERESEDSTAEEHELLEATFLQLHVWSTALDFQSWVKHMARTHQYSEQRCVVTLEGLALWAISNNTPFSYLSAPIIALRPQKRDRFVIDRKDILEPTPNIKEANEPDGKHF